MTRFTRAAVCGAFGLGLVVGPATAAFAAPNSTCDSYSGTCVLPKHYQRYHKTQVLPLHQTSPSTLPFTGADIAGMTLAGLAAVGGGAALVAAGRRRRVASTA